MKKLLTLSTALLFLLVLVRCGDDAEMGPPTNFAIVAGSDGITVVLSWDAPTDGEPDNYIVYFQAVGTTGYEGIDTSTTTTFTHDPSDETGTYYVAAVYGEEEEITSTLTTIPENTAAVTVYELEASGNAGYGWAISDDFSGGTYSMAEATNAALVDFYVTNFIDDPAGGPWPLNYHIASPNEATTDPGGGFVPQANWRQSWFSNAITDPQAALPTYSATTYFNWTEIDTDPFYVAAYLDDEGYYALVRFSGANATDGSIQAETWIQTVPGLQLIAH